MTLDYHQLAAVAAVVRSGSFERAARHLGVTPSAVSQRVKLMEERLGAVLVVRGQPCSATPIGDRLCRHAEEVGLLERALQDELGLQGEAQGRPLVRIAVNADSLSTWLVEGLAEAVPAPPAAGPLFDLVVDDQDHSADWLWRGAVSAAVSAQGGSGGVQGCGQVSLGALRYVATASPAFVSAWFPDGVDVATLGRAPSLRFNAKDELQARWAYALLGREPELPCHWLPSSNAFVDAAIAGLGWGMNPLAMAGPHLAAGRLVELVPGRPYDVPLFWHWSRLVEKPLAGLTRAIRAAARRHLVQPAP